ncbi:MAG: alpha-E domain-containing protein [Thiobacillus sp.]|nr:alpha-E domain-containing protein [Thiobacillus sp.]
MLARVGESLYWMARYLERAEDTARLINATTMLVMDMPRGASFGWEDLLKVVGLDEPFHKLYDEASETAVMSFLIQDERNPSSIFSCVRHARENTRTFREVLPRESWEWVNELYLYTSTHLTSALDRRKRYEILNEIIRRRQAVVGLLSGTMSRDEGFQFMRLGRNIERADMTTRVIDVSYAINLPRQNGDDVLSTTLPDLVWMSVLHALSAHQMYRRHVDVHARGHKVLAYLLNDLQFPRSVRHCLHEIQFSLDELPGAEPMHRLQGLLNRVDEANYQKLSENGLHEFCDDIQARLADLNVVIGQTFFRATDSQKLTQSQFVLT